MFCWWDSQDWTSRYTWILSKGVRLFSKLSWFTKLINFMDFGTTFFIVPTPGNVQKLILSMQTNFNGNYLCSTRDRVVYKEKYYSMSELKKVKMRKAHWNYIWKTITNAKEIITVGNKYDFEKRIPLLENLKANLRNLKSWDNKIAFLLQSENDIVAEVLRWKMRVYGVLTATKNTLV